MGSGVDLAALGYAASITVLGGIIGLGCARFDRRSSPLASFVIGAIGAGGAAYVAWLGLVASAVPFPVLILGAAGIVGASLAVLISRVLAHTPDLANRYSFAPGDRLG